MAFLSALPQASSARSPFRAVERGNQFVPGRHIPVGRQLGLGVLVLVVRRGWGLVLAGGRFGVCTFARRLGRLGAVHRLALLPPAAAAAAPALARRRSLARLTRWRPFLDWRLSVHRVRLG